jgi:DtxR family Mn-dependent transcriptional regulator
MTEAKLSASLEDYLEAIYNIILEKKAVRAKDIAGRLKVSNASVTGALRALAKRALLNYAPYDVITLTPEGEKVAREVARRHEILRDFFTKVLAVEYDKADAAACTLEHGVPGDIIDRLVRFIEFIEICPLGGEKLIQGFRRHLECGIDEGRCDSCVSMAKENAVETSGSESDRDEASNRVSLATLKQGERGIVRRIRAKGTLRQRLMEMGLTPGSLVEIERVAPMGDPVEVKTRGYHFTFRKEEVEYVEVEQR